MRPAKIALAIVTALLTILLLTTGAAASAHGSNRDRLEAVRDATDRYHSVSVAIAHQYGLLKDKDGIACIANPGVGAMGVHYVNVDLVKSGTINAVKPQALVYAPSGSGGLRLVAVEYVVFQADWDKTHKARPSLFGQRFMLTPDNNRYALPAFYSLHAWVWKHNPDGMFAMWNPNVHCDKA